MKLHITWPIADPNTASLKECKTEAMDDLRETLRRNALVATSGPIFGIHHGANAHVTVEVEVTYAQNHAAMALKAA